MNESWTPHFRRQKNIWVFLWRKYGRNCTINEWMNEWKLGPISPKNEGMKSANGILIGDGTKTFCTVCFKKKSCLPLSFWEKRSMMPRHKFWVLTYTHTHPKNVYIIRQNICAWAASKCVWSSLDTSCSGNWAVREKRCRHYLFFVPSPIKDFILFLAQFRQKVVRKKMATTSPKEFFLKKPRFSPDYIFSKVTSLAWSLIYRQVSLEQTKMSKNVTLPRGDENERFVVQCLVSMVVLSLQFGAINNRPIPQKFSILRLEVAKDVTWWGRCIINYMVPKPSCQTPKASCRIDTWQRQKLKLGN
jgi:hypothetical protein